MERGPGPGWASLASGFPPGHVPPASYNWIQIYLRGGGGASCLSICLAWRCSVDLHRALEFSGATSEQKGWSDEKLWLIQPLSMPALPISFVSLISQKTWIKFRSAAGVKKKRNEAKDELYGGIESALTGVTGSCEPNWVPNYHYGRPNRATGR